MRFLELFNAHLKGSLDSEDLPELYFLINSGQFDALMEACIDQSFRSEVPYEHVDEAWRDHTWSRVMEALNKILTEYPKSK